ncbi:MAG: SUF system NifU family Fe-S cluster assembly protein [Candidatus Gottesmanbacteria bacterium]
MDIYREIILDHYKHPHNFGHLEKPSASNTLFNSACGDKITMEVQIDAEGAVVDVRFSGEGCVISQASASMLTDSIKGKSKAEIMKLTASDIFSMLQTELTASRVKCAVLPLEVLQKTLSSTV